MHTNRYILAGRQLVLLSRSVASSGYIPKPGLSILALRQSTPKLGNKGKFQRYITSHIVSQVIHTLHNFPLRCHIRLRTLVNHSAHLGAFNYILQPNWTLVGVRSSCS